MKNKRTEKGWWKHPHPIEPNYSSPPQENLRLKCVYSRKFRSKFIPFVTSCLNSVLFQVKEEGTKINVKGKREEINIMSENQVVKVSSTKRELDSGGRKGIEEPEAVEEVVSGTFRSKCAKCMDPCVKIALITFPIFLIASILIGILGLSSSQVLKDNSTDYSSSPSSFTRNVTRFKAPTSTSTMIFRSDIINTTATVSSDEDTHFYSILFLILALTSLIVIFCGKYWTIGLYNPPDSADFRTNSTENRSNAQPVLENVLEEQITTVWGSTSNECIISLILENLVRLEEVHVHEPFMRNERGTSFIDRSFHCTFAPAAVDQDEYLITYGTVSNVIQISL